MTLNFSAAVPVDHHIRSITAPPLASFGDREFLHSRRIKGSSNMPQYRAYIIGSDGEFQNSVPLECPDDAVARKKARQLINGHHVELWQSTRKIATFDHKPHGAFQA
jgi:hypothetical protein